ncbi:sensor histidine kinase [Herbidospora mongoliensis]|uniref:sensor histidine kinase n=1 Tax=Herbidospora mongoliensis TaxID=688067 RepID=UPI00082C6D3F|nr:histidine kinase [Herbidospora mongoliensis]
MMRLIAARLARLRARVTRRRPPESADAVTRERLRIAEELHDVVAHDLSVLTLGVGAGRVIMDRDPERARQTLRDAEEAGRQALTDLQRVAGLLRSGGSATTGPQPTLGALPALLDRFRAAGLAVGFAEEGPRRPGPVLELSAYRIVEECLVNALERGGARKARVWLRWQGGMVELSVQDDGGPREHLLGIWERAALFGGSVTAGPVRGGFEVRVRLLTGGRARARNEERVS